MNSSLKKVEHNKYDLTVELNREDLAGYLRLAEDRIARELRVDGFRKGKAPRDLVRQKAGDQYILQEALDTALKDSLAKTIDKDNLDVLKVYDLNIQDNSSSRLLYTVKVSLFPSVSIGGLDGLKVQRREVEVDKSDVDGAVEHLRISHSRFIPKDKQIDKGDRVEIDFEVTSDGLPVEGGTSKNHPLVVGDDRFIPGFEDRLIGMKPGEEKQFSLNAPPDYFHKAVAGRKLDFTVKVVSVQEIQKPFLNDDFARSLGRFRGLTDLERSISEGILEEKRAKEKQRFRVEVLTKIFERSKVELPKDMVAEGLNDMITGFDNELHAKGMELSLYLTHLNKTEDDLRKDWEEEAKRQVAFALLLKKIAKDKNIKPSDREVEEAAEKVIQRMALKGELDKDSFNMEALKEALASDIANEKVFSFLESACSV